MRYFTRGWANGDLSDDEYARMPEAYARRLAEIAPRLPAAMLKLAREISLHDGLIARMRWRPNSKELTMTLVTGSVGPGYRTTTLTYVGALLGKSRIEALRNAGLDRETQLLYDEVDIDDDGLLVHRILFWPREEVTIDFSELRLEDEPREDRRVNLGPGFYEDYPDEDE